MLFGFVAGFVFGVRWHLCRSRRLWGGRERAFALSLLMKRQREDESGAVEVIQFLEGVWELM